MKCDWDEVVDVAAAVLVAIVVRFAVMLLFSVLVLLVLSGIALTKQGWWGIGVPVTIFGSLTGMVLLVAFFAQVMSWIEERKQ